MTVFPLPKTEMTENIGKGEELLSMTTYPKTTRHAGSPARAIRYLLNSLTVDLDGSGDYLATSTITEDWNSWSFSVWVNPRDFDTSANAYAIVEREVIGSYQDFELMLVGSRGTVVLENDSSSDLESTSMPENDTWTHIVVTYDGETKALYINGELEDSVEESNSQITVDRPLEIGRHANTSYRNYFNGLIDELRIYKVAISEQDVQTLYQDRG